MAWGRRFGKKKEKVELSTYKSANLSDALKKMTTDMNQKSLSLTGHKSTFVLGKEKAYCLINDWITTTCVPLDCLLWGGIPRKRITEIFGHNSEGKSSLLERLFLGNQLAGGYNALILSEGSIDPERMQRQGVDLNSMLLSEIGSFEEGVYLIGEIFNKIERDEFLKGIPVLIGWDTISNSEEESKRKTGNPYAEGMASKARNIRAALRHITPQLGRLNVTMVFISQTHATLGDMFGPGFSTDGGGGIKFNASLRLWIKRTAIIKPESKDEVLPYDKIGIWSSCRIEKSKCGPPPFRSVEFPIRSFSGIDNDLAMYEYVKDFPAYDRFNKPIFFKNEQAPLIKDHHRRKLFGMPGNEDLTFSKEDVPSGEFFKIPGVRQYLADQCRRTLPPFVYERFKRPILEPDKVRLWDLEMSKFLETQSAPPIVNKPLDDSLIPTNNDDNEEEETEDNYDESISSSNDVSNDSSNSSISPEKIRHSDLAEGEIPNNLDDAGLKAFLDSKDE